jgi:hypothetical protein
MFAKYDDAVKPTKEGIESLAIRHLCSPGEMAAMRSMAALRAKLPDAYRVVGHRPGVDHPWVHVAARWDGNALSDDVSAEIREAVKPMMVRYAGFDDGMFSWMVQAPTPEDEETSKDAPKAQAEGTPVVFATAPPAQTLPVSPTADKPA